VNSEERRPIAGTTVLKIIAGKIAVQIIRLVGDAAGIGKTELLFRLENSVDEQSVEIALTTPKGAWFSRTSTRGERQT
jgi:predicted ATP-dependent serine protease